MIKVSVITYVKNDKAHIAKCLQSVIDQTLKDIEIIVVDGGSTDGTMDIIRDFEQSDSRVRVMSTGIGVGKQFNTGLIAASGEYIGICESDDFISPEMFEKEYEVASKFNLDFLQADFNGIFEISGVIHRIPLGTNYENSVYETLLNPSDDERILKVNASGFWSGVYRREFLLENGIFMNETPGASYQDTSFSFLTKVYAKRAWVMRDRFYEYRQDNFHSSTNDPKRMKAIFKEYDMLEKRLRDAGEFEQYKEYYLRLRIQGTSWFYGILDKEGRDNLFPVISKDILTHVSSEEYTCEKLDEFEKSLVENASKTPEDLYHAAVPYKESNPEVDRFEEELRYIDENDKVVIFGAGKLGEKLWLFLAERGIFATAFADNNVEKHGTTFCHTEVMNPQKIIDNLKSLYWIIANLHYADDIRAQLMKMGIDMKRIIICPGYDILQRIVPQKN